MIIFLLINQENKADSKHFKPGFLIDTVMLILKQQL